MKQDFSKYISPGETDLFFKKLIVTQAAKHFQPHMNPEVSLSCSQEHIHFREPHDFIYIAWHCEVRKAVMNISERIVIISQ
jgi:hypothetical protein